MKHKFIFILLLLQVGLISGKDYEWPLKNSDLISGTFGEYRTGHYHSAIDIKTNYTTGHPVYAAADGYVRRIVVKSRGYGKAVYIKMDNGKYAVYSHLQGFTDKIEKIVKQEQQKLSRFRINKFLKSNKIPVQKGEKIAYTGQSGTTAPHLHFEIRTEDQKPINPLATNLSIYDNTSPKIDSIALVPLSDSARIEGLPRITTFPAQGSYGEYSLTPKNISIKGEFGVEIKTYDIIQNLYHQYGPYRIKLRVNDSLAFMQQYDTLSFKKATLIKFDRDKQLMQEGRGRYIRMWHYLPDKKMPFYQGKQSGIISLNRGKHNIELIVEDYNGNTSTLKFNVENSQFKKPVINKYNKKADKLYLNIKRDSSKYLYRSIKPIWINKHGKEIQADFVDFAIEDDLYKMTLKKPAATYRTLKLEAIPVNSVIKKEKFIPIGNSQNSSNSVTFDYNQNPETFTVEYKFEYVPDSIPEFYLQLPNTIKKINSQATSPKKYITNPIKGDLLEKATSIEISTRGKKVSHKEVDFNYITSNDSKVVWSSDTGCSVKFYSGSVYRDLSTSIFHYTAEKNLPQVEFISSEYEIFPLHSYFNQDPTINIKMKSDVDDFSQISVYKLEEDDFIYHPSNLNFQKREFTAEISAGGRYQLIRDQQPPLITRAIPGNNSNYKNRELQYIKAKIEDEIAGIRDAMSISLKVDNEEVIAEYNSATKVMKYELEHLSTGKHTYEISATDRVGNTKTIHKSFYIE